VADIGTSRALTGAVVVGFVAVGFAGSETIGAVYDCAKNDAESETETNVVERRTKRHSECDA